MALRVGFGTSTITPPLPTHLAGYGDRSEAAIGVRDELEARAVVLDDDGRRVCLLTLDLLATTPEVGRTVRAAVAGVLGIEQNAVLTSCTHTHAGPGTLIGAEVLGWSRPEGYLDALPELAADAALDALERLTPATVAFASAELPDGVAANRRGHPLRPAVAILDVHDLEGERIGTIANLGMHPTVSGPANLHVATDWIGPFRRAVEALAGGTTVFLQGCQGDVNPATTSWDDPDPAAWGPVVDEVGASIAAVVVDALPTASPVTGTVAAPRVRTITIPVAETILGALAGGATSREVELVSFDLGDAQVVGIPGEAFHAAEAALRARVGPRSLLAGLAPDWHGYLPLPFTEGYEEQLSFGADATAQVLAAVAER